MEKKQSVGKFLLLHGGMLLGAIVLGFVLLLAVYALPTGPMKANVAESLDMLEREGDYPVWAEGTEIGRLDQCSDAVMMKIAVMDSDMGLVKKSLLNPLLSVEEDSDIPQTSNIRAQLNGDYSEGELLNYSRYWNGYLVVLKPLLMVLNVSQIRVLSMVLQGLLLLAALWLVKERLNGYYAVAFLVTVLLMSPISIALCMQYKNTYWIALVATILLLWMDRKGISNRWPLVFMLGGIAVAYFDLLSVPLITLTIPLAVFLALCAKRKELTWKTALLPCVAWGVGYGVMWFGEWVLATLLTGENVIKDAFERTLMRSGGDVEGVAVTFFGVIRANLATFKNPVILLLAVLGVAALVWFLVRNKKKIHFEKTSLWFLFVMAIPFAWYFVTKNHSYIHTLFAYRLLVGALLAGLCFVGSLVDFSGIRKN